MQQIINYLESNNINKNTFIDLGCSNGKTFTYAIIYGFKQAQGAEIVEIRYEYVERKIKELKQRMRDRITI